MGRFAKSDYVCTHASVSNNHLEFRLMPAADGGIAESGLCFCARDISNNGTAIELPGASVARLPKNVDSLVQESSLIVLPLNVKKKDKEPRTCFRIHFGVGPVPCVPVPSPDCDAAMMSAPGFQPPDVVPAAEAPEDVQVEK